MGFLLNTKKEFAIMKVLLIHGLICLLGTKAILINYLVDKKETKKWFS